MIDCTWIARLAPRERELLRTLRQRHVSAIALFAGQLRTEIQPLLGAAPGIQDSGPGNHEWQARVPELVTSAQETDRLLNRLLAGSYSEPSVQDMLRGLAVRIRQLELAIQFQQ